MTICVEIKVKIVFGNAFYFYNPSIRNFLLHSIA